MTAPIVTEERYIDPRTVREHPLRTMDEIVASLAYVSPFSQEGYVVCSGPNDAGRVNRVKVKSPQYVAMHHARDAANPKWFLDVIRRGETPEVVSYFPELAPDFDAVRARYDALVSDLDAGYAAIAAIPEQKAFAFEAVKSPWSGVFFQRRKFGRTTADVLREWHLDKLADGLGIRGNGMERIE